jgi:hypothetical protein
MLWITRMAITIMGMHIMWLLTRMTIMDTMIIIRLNRPRRDPARPN